MPGTMGGLLLTVCCTLALAGPARADAEVATEPVAAVAPSAAATGFLLEGALAVGTTVGLSMGLGGVGFTGLAGSLRAGWMTDVLAVALDVAYRSDSGEDDAGNPRYEGSIVLGPLAQIFLWQSSDRAARLYGLLGAGFGDYIERTSSDDPFRPDEEDDTFLATLDLGFGGCYFLHPNFLMGLEVGSKTYFLGFAAPAYASYFFAALTLGFVAG